MSTLYLCKMDPNAARKFVAIIGIIIQINADGREFYQFIPHMASHKRSRKLWDSAVGCIPKWTERHGFLRLLDKAELDELRSNDRVGTLPNGLSLKDASEGAECRFDSDNGR